MRRLRLILETKMNIEDTHIRTLEYQNISELFFYSLKSGVVRKWHIVLSLLQEIDVAR